MDTNTSEKNIFNQIAWIIFIIFMCFASVLPGINIPGIGLLYPLRICLPFMALYLFINERKYGYISNTLADTIFFILVLLLYGMLTLLWSQDKSSSIKQLFNYVIGFFIVIVMVRFIRTKQQFYKIIMLMAYVLIVIMIMGIYESLSGHYFFAKNWTDIKPYRQYDFYYPVVSFGNPNDMVFVLFGMMPFINMACKNLYAEKRKIFYKIVMAIYLALYLVITFLASCRMGMLVIAIALIVNLLFSNNKLIFTSTLVLCVVGIFVLIINYNMLLNFLSDDARVVIWQNVLKNAAHYHFMGIGPGNSALRIEGVEYINDYLTNPHFFLLEVFAEFGILVFIVFILWAVFNIKRVFNNYIYADNKSDKIISCTAIKFIIYFLPMNIMSSSISAMPHFWFILSMFLLSIDLSRPIKTKAFAENKSNMRCNYIINKRQV